MGGISIWQLLIIAVIVVLLFGTKKLRGIGGDFGQAVKGFKDALNDDAPKKDQAHQVDQHLEQHREKDDHDENSKQL